MLHERTCVIDRCHIYFCELVLKLIFSFLILYKDALLKGNTIYYSCHDINITHLTLHIIASTNILIYIKIYKPRLVVL